jgi:hypothetical protein
MDCDFSTPLNFAGNAPSAGEPFAFSEMQCIDEKYENIVNQNSSANFYLNKNISYGDILIIFFFIFITCIIVFKILWNFNFKDPFSKI